MTASRKTEGPRETCGRLPSVPSVPGSRSIPFRKASHTLSSAPISADEPRTPNFSEGLLFYFFSHLLRPMCFDRAHTSIAHMSLLGSDGDGWVCKDGRLRVFRYATMKMVPELGVVGSGLSKWDAPPLIMNAAVWAMGLKWGAPRLATQNEHLPSLGM